jgi:hypothetical protein
MEKKKGKLIYRELVISYENGVVGKEKQVLEWKINDGNVSGTKVGGETFERSSKHMERVLEIKKINYEKDVLS